MKILEEAVLSEAANSQATDIHIDPTLDNYQIRFRVDGQLRLWKELPRDSGISLINQFKATVGIEPGTAFFPRGERFKSTVGERELDLRVTLVPCISGPKIAIRILEPKNVVRDIPDLGLQKSEREKLEEWSRTLNGMILVTGPTSSGKTTTLYSLLHELAEVSRHVVTVEDPVEYEIDGINQIQVDLRHRLDFAEGVKAALRLDPDCLMVGEIRDHDAAFEAINAAVQGHVVMATMHSRDAASTVTRLRNFEIEDHQIASAVGVVVNQRLVRKLCRNCREEHNADDEMKTLFHSDWTLPPSRCFRPAGCDKCQGTGYFGRTGIFEIWNLSPSDYQMILDGKDEKQIREKLRREGHRFVLEDAATKINEGIVSFSDVRMSGLELPWTN